MLKSSIITLTVASGLLFSSFVQAEATDYQIEPVHSQVIFKINHLGFSNSYGKFRKFEGNISFDPENWATASADVTINTKSIDLENKKWNDHMRSSDFFNIEKFPTMTFKSSKLEKTGDDTGLLHGQLTLLGKTLPVTLDVTVNQIGTHPFSEKPYAGFSASGMIKRSEFGMEAYVPAVADEVHIIIEVEAAVK